MNSKWDGSKITAYKDMVGKEIVMIKSVSIKMEICSEMKVISHNITQK
jgi:hypothetical protein